MITVWSFDNSLKTLTTLLVLVESNDEVTSSNSNSYEIVKILLAIERSCFNLVEILVLFSSIIVL